MPERRFDATQQARMDTTERRKLLPQEHILSLLNIQDTDTLLDIGAGAGYFTFPLAERTKNTVYALDIEQEMIDYMQAQAQTKQNITFLQASMEEMPLDTNTIDRALASMVLHETETLERVLLEIYRVLKPGGRFVVIDWVPEPNDTRPNRIDSGDMQRAAEQAGFAMDLLTTPSDQVYAIALNKPKQDD